MTLDEIGQLGGFVHAHTDEKLVKELCREVFKLVGIVRELTDDGRFARDYTITHLTSVRDTARETFKAEPKEEK